MTNPEPKKADIPDYAIRIQALTPVLIKACIEAEAHGLAAETAVDIVVTQLALHNAVIRRDFVKTLLFTERKHPEIDLGALVARLGLDICDEVDKLHRRIMTMVELLKEHAQ